MAKQAYGQILAMDVRDFQIMEIRVAVIRVIIRNCLRHSPHSRAFVGRNVPDLCFPGDHQGDVFALFRIVTIHHCQAVHQTKSKCTIRTVRGIDNVLNGHVGLAALCVGRQADSTDICSFYLLDLIGGHSIHMEAIRFQIVLDCFVSAIIFQLVRI